MTYRSDKAEGPTAGPETCDPLEFLARVVTHIPDKGQVMQRYSGWYANRTRGRRRAQGADRGAMRVLAVITEPAVIDRILAHLRATTAAQSPCRSRGPPRRSPALRRGAVATRRSPRS